ncbi:FAD:protein FMN transferase [Sphingobacterium bovistauri]|uniref:FAD:protein FMN transferase n=1 Tax=Sphingobacterium bovistauri TaxID=2781959 RepID=A0ABS7Z358_9SPHI|nr:FAD:protein FMN transferase [Sphingobacterium bovistauri]MCA5004596.1 FAD:protein FMN transferase [Sphingobacterium bovistauri]
MNFFILISYILVGYSATAEYPTFKSPHTIRGTAQGTTYDIKYYASDQVISKSEVDSIFRVIDESMSLYKPNSLINQFNSRDVKGVKLDAHMYNVVKASFQYYKMTKGYFDITIFPLLKLWGFGPEGFRFNPSESQIDSVRKTVGLDKIKLRKDYLKKRDKYVSIDLNGIAQGYTVDVLSQFIKSRGVDSFIVEVGGEIYAHGIKPSGERYKIEIQRPYSQQIAPYRLELQNKAITTSGSYEKFRILEGNRISHHIDPHTGRPLMNNTLSVTIIANTAMEADALDNYLMYLEPSAAINFIEKKTDCEAYIIYSENNTLKELQSSGFNNYIY